MVPSTNHRYISTLDGWRSVAIIGLLGLMRSRTEFISFFLFLCNYLPVHLGGVYTAHLWSLAIEEHFYLIWPGLLLLCGIKRAPIMTAVLIVVCALWRATELRLHLLSRFLPDTNPGARTDLRLDATLTPLWKALPA